MKKLVIIILILILNLVNLYNMGKNAKVKRDELYEENLVENNIEVSEASENILLEEKIEELEIIEEDNKSVENTEKSVLQESVTDKENMQEKVAKQENKKKQEVAENIKEEPKIEDKQEMVEEKQEEQVEVKYTENKINEIKENNCNGNNHGIGAGNSGKWYETKEEAISYYTNLIEYWEEWWLNADPNDTEADETYYKNCPDGYEIWSCPYCGKWTINLYY